VLINLLCVIPPSKFEEEHIPKLIHRMTKKRGLFRKKPLEDIKCKGMVWMPYYRIEYSYTRSGKALIRRYGKTGRSETVLNAMFCGSVMSERDLFILFRPNYLKREIIGHFPQSEEIVGPTVHTDFDEVLVGLLKRLNEVKDELDELRSVLSKNRARIRRYSMIVPIIGGLKKEKRLSEKVARLNALKIILSMCLNVDEDISSIRVTGHSIFYYPTLVATLKHNENGTERYLIIDLVGGGVISKHLSCDKGLTELCNRNSMCKEVNARLITSYASRK